MGPCTFRLKHSVSFRDLKIHFFSPFFFTIMSLSKTKEQHGEKIFITRGKLLELIERVKKDHNTRLFTHPLYQEIGSRLVIDGEVVIQKLICLIKNTKRSFKRQRTPRERKKLNKLVSLDITRKTSQVLTHKTCFFSFLSPLFPHFHFNFSNQSTSSKSDEIENDWKSSC